MKDTELQQAVQEGLLHREEPPSFEDTWHAVEHRYRRGRQRKAMLAGLAATIAAVAILFNALAPEPEELAFIEMAELLETTSWQAPSDALMPTREFDIYQDLPDLMESTDQAGGAFL